eukprot:TRINITY_DN6689_c0_g1_i1.p1 TRINITY_DN6689_c0_g1~~TRINITY_DN6689_c0_g1_i1.p1  ORF type:complete len:292 (-),score=88.47 TRINITY_DN6689_c0_g1_i1:2-877(-)
MNISQQIRNLSTAAANPRKRTSRLYVQFVYYTRLINDQLKNEEKERQEESKRLTVKINSPSGIGGYHSVSIPFSESAKSEIEKLKSGTANFVELEIDDSKEKVNASPAKSVSGISELKGHLKEDEPRFYIYAKNTVGTTPSTFVFIYCCPEKSPQKLRMVYSTSKPGVADQVTSLGISLAEKKVEITDITELTEDVLQPKRATQAFAPPAKSAGGSWNQPSGGGGSFLRQGGQQNNNNNRVLPEGGGTAKAKSTPTVNNVHPLGKLMQNSGQNLEGSSTKKKIVIPPPNAW